jgi:hypothetical protein
MCMKTMCRPVDRDVVLASFEHRVIWKMMSWWLAVAALRSTLAPCGGGTGSYMDARDGVMGRVVGAFLAEWPTY